MAQLTAPIKWAQRKGSIFLTIDLSDVDPKTAKIELSDKKLVFKGVSQSKTYTLELEFFKEVDSKDEKTKYLIKERGISFFLVKKEEGFWSRLLENKQLQKTNVKVDFNKWVDSDDEGEDNDFDTEGMEGFGGGMPGMGMPGMGMPGMGMPGMEGMDMSAMMEQMKQMKGNAGEDFGGDEQQDDSDDDDELPDLEEVDKDKK